jgi:hypothetical protein
MISMGKCTPATEVYSIGSPVVLMTQHNAAQHRISPVLLVTQHNAAQHRLSPVVLMTQHNAAQHRLYVHNTMSLASCL